MEFLTKLLPWIGAAATGNVPALVAMAAKTVGDVIGVDVAPTAAAISKAVSGASSEQMAAMQTADNEFKLKMQALGFEHEEEIAKLALEETKTYVGDTQSARDKFSANQSIFKLGVIILVAFALTVALSMFGAYQLLSGGITIKDVGIVAAVFSFLGTIVGYMAANAQQVVGFFFGSSKGSSDTRETLSTAVTQLGAMIAKR
jgi:hypothetical protein